MFVQGDRYVLPGAGGRVDILLKVLCWLAAGTAHAPLCLRTEIGVRPGSHAECVRSSSGQICFLYV